MRGLEAETTSTDSQTLNEYVPRLCVLKSLEVLVSNTSESDQKWRNIFQGQILVL